MLNEVDEVKCHASTMPAGPLSITSLSSRQEDSGRGGVDTAGMVTSVAAIEASMMVGTGPFEWGGMII